VRNLLNLVSSPHFTLGDDAKIESRPMMRDQQGGHPRIIHANPETIASYSRLRDFKNGDANLVSVADTNFTVRESFDGEVFSKLPVVKVIAAELAFPMLIGLALI